MIYSLVVFALVAAAYLIWEFNFVKNATVMDLLKDFVDVSPCVLLLFFNNPHAAVFLALCLIANEFIYDDWILGGVVFAAAYLSASVFASSGLGLNLMALLVCLCVMIAAGAPIVIFYKGKIGLKIGACAYALVALVPCVYAFSVTTNPGFILLAIGDVMLGLYGITNNKIVKAVANILYFAGTCLVPLAL